MGGTRLFDGLVEKSKTTSVFSEETLAETSNSGHS